MDMTRFGTIAQLVYADKQPLNFARLVGELHLILEQFYGPDVSFEWDCEDIAFFDLPATRIALGWDDRPGKGYSACMTVSVGPLPDILPHGASDRYEEICSRMVERLHRRYPALAILWHQTDERLTSDLLDRLIEGLPPLMQLFPFQEPDWVADAMARQSPGRAVALRGAEVVSESSTATKETTPVYRPAHKSVVEPIADLVPNLAEKSTELVALKFSARSASARARARARAKSGSAATIASQVPEVANDHPSLPRQPDLELARLRDALYLVEPEDAPAPMSTQLRLTAHALNATLILVWAPLGAAVMTYSLLKGEDMKLSARLMVLTGLFATALGGPIGQKMVTIIGA
ncbi:hypothetical protein [Cypionkella sp.]|uniref:hypothetical protein n=1 Tax=Cypionkella sp. TaxID=2811411 RepID=UPI002ABA5C8F|nr:hypothetical protein [Cypionkella sp.]MDZ4395146.1 hypothetical protein [Cypionkella sp.]